MNVKVTVHIKWNHKGHQGFLTLVCIDVLLLITKYPIRQNLSAQLQTVAKILQLKIWTK